MRLFELRPDDSCDYAVEANHRWGLPGVKCDACGATWSNVGVAYPVVDLSVLPNANRYTNFWPVPWNEFEQLRAPILELLPKGAVAPPGTDFGPLVGRVTGALPDLVWRDTWTLLTRPEVLARLKREGIEMPKGAKAKLQGRQQADLIELQLEPHATLAASCLPPGEFAACSVCGRRGIKRPHELVVESSSVPENLDFFRLSDLTTAILATERAVKALTELKLTGFHSADVPLEQLQTRA